MISATQVYAGAVAALALMTVLSAVMGWAAPNLVRRCACFRCSASVCLYGGRGALSSACCAQISKKYTQWGAVALFFFFGARSLYDALTGEVLDACDVLCKHHDQAVAPVCLMLATADHFPINTRRRESQSSMK